jgi:hypothetical protein
MAERKYYFLWALTTIAIFILLIACFNFVNPLPQISAKSEGSGRT